jgi:hypothetical protein
MQQQFLSIWDLVLTPLYLIILTIIAKTIRDKKYPKGDPIRKYYLPGLYIKFAGVIFIGLLYDFYYHGGDTFNYYSHSKFINSALDQSFETWLKLILRTPASADPQVYPYASQMEFYNDVPSHIVSVIGALFGLLNFTTYLPIALLFAFFSYTGIWAMFRTFTTIYPKQIKALAIAFLFIPSVFVWGSSIFKDTVCMFGLGWLTYTTFRIFVNRNFTFGNIFLLLFSFYMIVLVKLYIIVAFIPALAFWLLLSYSHYIRNASNRFLLRVAVIAISGIGFVYIAQSFSKELNSYSLENIIKTSESIRSYITYVSTLEEGSKYDLGKIEPTPIGMATKIPAGIIVTLFRPYLWEVKKPIMLLSSLEGLAFIILTLMVFYKVGFFNTIKKIAKDPNLLFFFIFSMIFAFAVGISTGNFGTLSRYKIPCMPFFAALLLILYYQHKTPSKNQVNASIKKKPLHHLT